MKKSESIAKYVEAYLEGKSEEQRQRFYEKDENRRYAAVMAWKRRQELKSTQSESGGTSEIMRNLGAALKGIKALSAISDRDKRRLLEEVESIRINIADFDAIRARLELERLEEDRRRLEEKMTLLRVKAYGSADATDSSKY